jgi:pimeloyl-ACP methyl ester carboxylesterase
MLVTACTPPISVTKLTPAESVGRFNRTGLTDDSPSEATMTTLRRHELADDWQVDPQQALRVLHSQVVGRPEAWRDLFALAELSYLQARKTGNSAQYLAAAIYAFAFLVPSTGEEGPNSFDPRFRQACDIYNLSLIAAMPRTQNETIALGGGQREVPFGTLNMTMSSATMDLDRRATFQPTGLIKVDGLQNSYRRSGLGASLAASFSTTTSDPTKGFVVAPALKLPASLLLLLKDPRRQLTSTTLNGQLVIHTISDADTIRVGGQVIPIEYDQTAARSLGLVETAAWSKSYRGFLSGTMYEASPRQLMAIQPHQRGRIPIVFVHGTASSPFRWADMVNDLLEDRRISDHFEFWFFSYASGNPIPYSALLLRESLDAAVEQLGGIKADPALGHMVVIGHSQGGLLTKMLAVDPGSRLWDSVSREPLDQLTLNAESRDLIRRAFFPRPSKEVDRVVFIATPHQGSYIAATSIPQMIGRLVTFPGSVASAGVELLSGNADRLKVAPNSLRIGSVYGMLPGSPFIKALAAEPIAPGVHVNSIIPVATAGAVEEGDDGVVSYQSAHVSDAESELVVRSDHSAQSAAVTDEVHRILLLQMSQTCTAPTCSGSPITQAMR